MAWLSDPQIWASFLTLTALEIVLGIDNLVFIAILAGRLPAERQDQARKVGLALALLSRLMLLGAIAWIIDRHPTVKMLALSFLLLIGMSLIADGAGFPVPKGYIYAAIGFSIAIEALNQLAARRRKAGRGGDLEARGRPRSPSSASTDG